MLMLLFSAASGVFFFSMSTPIAQCAELEKKLKEVIEELKPFLSDNLETQLSKLDPIESAQLLVLLSFGINTLTFCYLKTQGINPKLHPVKEEIARCKMYFEKIKSLNAKPTMKIDKAAAERFINNGLKKGKDKGKGKKSSLCRVQKK